MEMNPVQTATTSEARSMTGTFPSTIAVKNTVPANIAMSVNTNPKHPSNDHLDRCQFTIGAK